MAKELKYLSGKYNPKSPEKYAGDYTNIIYRSSWELKFFNWCDQNESIIRWSSEEIAIPYKCPTDNKLHRYFPDALISVKDKNNLVTTYLVEIKPQHQTKPPEVKQKTTKRYLTEVMIWGKNSAKWDAARQYCESRGYKFIILTEQDLGIR